MRGNKRREEEKGDGEYEREGMRKGCEQGEELRGDKRV